MSPKVTVSHHEEAKRNRQREEFKERTKWLHKFTKWLRGAVSQSVREGKLQKDFAGPISNWDAIDILQKSGYRSLLDHWGRRMKGLFLNHTENWMIRRRSRRSRSLPGTGLLLLDLKGKAKWNPGNTIRIEFFKDETKKEQDDAE